MKRMQRVFGDIDALRFVDDRLGEDRRAAFLAHIADDPKEAARVRTWANQNEAIRSRFGGIAHEPLPLWLKLSSLEAECDTSPAPDAPSRSEPRLVLVDRPPPAPQHSGRKVVAAVAVLLVASSVGVLAMRNAAPWSAARDVRRTSVAAEATPSFVARAVEAYQTFATDPVRPVEIGWGQQAQLEQWLRRRLDFSVRVPDLGPLGWAFLGGRILPGEAGPAAFLVYDNPRGERLGVYVGRAAPQAGLLFNTMPGGSVASWSVGQADTDAVGMAVTVGQDLAWLSGNIEPLKHRMRSIIEP